MNHQVDPSKAVLTLGAIVLAAAAVLWVMGAHIARISNSQACTTEEKICPDGSYVVRTGPDCEFTACPVVATTTSSGGTYASGVRGTVSLGPTCPVERIPPDPSCANKPYATAITVYRANASTPYIIGNSDAGGTFAFSLPPGYYTLVVSGGAVFPRCSKVDVTVQKNAYATTTISCDMGIR